MDLRDMFFKFFSLDTVKVIYNTHFEIYRNSIKKNLPQKEKQFLKFSYLTFDFAFFQNY